MNRIVFVISSLSGGGAERVTATLASELSQMDKKQVHIILYQDDGAKEYPLHPNVVRHIIPTLSGNRISKIYSRIRFLRQMVKQIAPDCVVSLGAAHVVGLLSIAMIGLKIPLILSERNDPKKMPQSKFKRMYRLLSYAFCDGVVFQTEGAKNFFPKFIRRKSTVICNPITANLPSIYKGDREHKIVNFCRLVPQKNLGLLIDAFAEISTDFPSYKLWIYGEGQERSALEQRINEYGLNDKVILPGYSNNIYEEINSASLFVSSSDYEGISNSMLEAIALGIPSICTDCPPGGAAETIENGVNGLLVPVRDKCGLANAMRRVLLDRQLSEKMSLAGITLRDKLSVSEVSNKWLDFISKCSN